VMQAPETPRPHLGVMHGTYLARVVSVTDPDDLARVQIRLLSTPEAVGDEDAAVWARVAAPFAGNKRGAFFLPDVGDEVAVVFVNGDPRQPLVVGGLWSGSAPPPEALGGSRVDRWSIVSRAGSRIAIVEETEGQATVSMETPAGGGSITITQKSGGSIVIEAGGSSVTLDGKGITLDTPNKVTVTASSVEVNAPQVTVNAAMSTFSGLVKCDILQTNTCIATTYTPGAGNVW
jgi:uncharacterized protein involved in type VI secretion and phage assembly